MWVTPGASTDSTCSSFTSPTFSNSRAPPPSRIGATETTISSSRPAARYCCATDAPPPRDTSFSPPAARACSSADSIPSVTKWNVVPPCISSGSRGWLVRTKTGWWKGGLSPHQPLHASSHGPGPPPNMFRPMMVAPAPPRMSSANGVLALTSPPSSPWLSRNALSGTSQSWSSSPPTPSGCSGDWCGPATKPSIDIVMFSFSLLIGPPLCRHPRRTAQRIRSHRSSESYGVMQGNGAASDEDRRKGFERGGWAMGVFDDETMTFINQTYQRADAFLFGRRTYEIFAGYGGAEERARGAAEDPGNHQIADALNTKPTYLASTTLTEPRWANTTVLSGDLAAAIGELKATPAGELQVHGSGALIRWLLENDLVDELTLLIVPVVLGQGTRLFPDAGPDIALDLVDSRADSKGVTIQVYRPTGRPRYATGAANHDDE